MHGVNAKSDQLPDELCISKISVFSILSGGDRHRRRFESSRGYDFLIEIKRKRKRFVDGAIVRKAQFQIPGQFIPTIFKSKIYLSPIAIGRK